MTAFSTASLPLLVVIAFSSVAGCGAQPSEQPLGQAVAAVDPSCDFGLANGLPLPQVPPVIERDRMFMADQPGMITKQLPISFDATGNVFSGGRYLFDTYDHARSYADFVELVYRYDERGAPPPARRPR